MQDCLFMDGSLKSGGKKYFYSKYTGEDVEKEIKSVNPETFESFQKLFYYNEEGEVVRIDDTLAADIENNILNGK